MQLLNENLEPVENVSRIRRVFPQIVAATAQSLHSIDTGLVLVMPTIVIPAITGIPNGPNSNEFLTMTAVQASWIGSIEYLFLPFGSLASGIITDSFGRKWSMILMNIPFIIGWLMLYQAIYVWQIFIAFVFLGFAIGLTVQVSVYFGEICEPSVRGILIGYANILGTVGGFLGLLFNTLMPWRTVASTCLVVPLICAAAIYFIPETPQWLLSKDRVEEAEKSLCWLRGWVPKQMVFREFQELKRHSEQSKSCDSCIQQNIKCSHPLPSLSKKLLELKQKRTCKPFTILVALFFLNQFTGVYAMRPFIVQIFKAYNSPISPDEAATIMSFSDSLANLVFMCLIHFTGKRGLYLATASGSFLCALVISCYGFIYLQPGLTSFDPSHSTQQLESNGLAYIPMVCLILWSFFSFCGFVSVPWTFVCEILSFKSRVVAGSILAVINSLFGFISRKTYYSLEKTLSLPGVSLFYCVVCFIGLITMYFIMPETEGRSLQDIELHFSDDSKKITDWIISKSSNRSESSANNDNS